MFIKENIKKYRKQAGLTQKELAEKTGLSYSFITKIEAKTKKAKQSASFSTIAAIAAVLNVKISDIYEFDSFLSANPYDYIDAKTKKHLNYNGYTRDKYTGNTS